MLKIFTGRISSDDMTKQLIINSCEDCPYFDEDFNNADPKYNRCKKKNDGPKILDKKR